MVAGLINNGVGSGEDVIDDGRYQTTAVVHAANGMSADQHEFQLTRRDGADHGLLPDLLGCPQQGGRRQQILDSVVQEIDIPTGLVLFEWHALDHLSVGNSVKQPWKKFTSRGTTCT